MENTYRIEDEPQASKLSNLVVNPFWPLLGVMLGGVWLGWIWFIINGFAVGSPTRIRELLWIIVGFAGSFLLAISILILYENYILHEGSSLQYAILVLVVWKLAISYIVFSLQARTFELYQYYGGIVRNGVWVLIIATMYGRQAVLSILPFDSLILVLK